jgi:hypothetical protein
MTPIGMAVDSGKAEEKRILADRLDEAAVEASGLNLWVNGRPASDLFSEVASKLRAGEREGL